MTYIRDNKKNDLPNCGCSDGSSDNAIIADVYSFLSLLDGNKLDFDTLHIPIEGSTKNNYTLKPSQRIFLTNTTAPEKDKFLSLFIKDNKYAWWRFVTSTNNDFFPIFYDYKIKLITTDLTDQRVGVNIEITLTPRADIMVLTWNNIDGQVVEDTPFTNWRDIDLTWNQISPVYTNNQLVLPSMVYNLAVDFTALEDGDVSQKFLVNVVDDDINFEIEFLLDYVAQTNIATFEITSSKLVGLSYNDSVFSQQISETIDITDNIITVENIGRFNSTKTKKYNSLRSILVLATEDSNRMKHVEVFNSSKDSITFQVLSAV